MTFPELTHVMLNSMDFFELRRTAARYAVPYQGVRRQKLIRDLERRILAKSAPRAALHPEAITGTEAARYPVGATSAKPQISGPKGAPRINTFSTRNTISRLTALK